MPLSLAITQLRGPDVAGEQEGMASALLIPLHVKYITSLASHTSSLTYHLTTHLRLNAIYWAVTALHLLNAPGALLPDDVVEYVLSCYDARAGGFGAHVGHDAHILATLSGLQILYMYNRLGDLTTEQREAIAVFILSLQNEQTGQFAGDASKLEYDNRFMYCSVAALALLSTLGHSDQDESPRSQTDDDNVRLYDPLTRLNRDETIGAILQCYNFDGGFGRVAGSESHASQSFVCIGALRILGGMGRLTPAQRLNHACWLSERQMAVGGFNGRPQKLEDVCYSWWVASALAMLGKLSWVNADALANFIKSCQDPDFGGIADRPDNVADVFHTLFGTAGLSMLGQPHGQGLQPVDPVFCMPVSCVARSRRLKREYQTL